MAPEDEIAIATRTSWHTLAEHVLAAGLHAATGRIGLRPLAGGFGTPWFEGSGGRRRLRIDGTDVVVDDDRGARRMPITTVRAAAAFTGVEPGAPADVYRPATPLELDRALTIDPAVAAQLAGWYELTADALEQLRAEHEDERPAAVQLWPEHLDVATTIGEVNYGGSPGDDGHRLPYLYVGPFEPPVPDGAFWNEPFGSSTSAREVTSAEDALAYFRAGRDRLDRLDQLDRRAPSDPRRAAADER